MATVHTALQAVVKYFNPGKLTAPTHIVDFKLSQIQYKAVFGALVACGILSGLTNWFSRIDCSLPDSTAVDKKYIEEWCYANSTFVIERQNEGFSDGNDYAPSADGVIYLGYFQWVTLSLILQAACFQIPRLIWKCAESGRVPKIVEKLAKVQYADLGLRKQALRDVVNYFDSPFRRKSTRYYFASFAISQWLYLINVVVQICFTQSFLQNEFLNLVPQFILGSTNWNRIFPKNVKCKTSIYTPTGLRHTVDVSCVLSLNVLFEKLYLMVWIILAIALCTSLAQIVQLLLFIFGRSPISVDADKPLNTTDRLLLKFLKSSLEPALFDELLEEMKKSGAEKCEA